MLKVVSTSSIKLTHERKWLLFHFQMKPIWQQSFSSALCRPMWFVPRADACVYTVDGYLKAKVIWQLPGNHSMEAKIGLQSNTVFEGLLKAGVVGVRGGGSPRWTKKRRMPKTKEQNPLLGVTQGYCFILLGLAVICWSQTLEGYMMGEKKHFLKECTFKYIHPTNK